MRRGAADLFIPGEIRRLKLRWGFFGYPSAVVDRAIGEIAGSFENVWRQRAEIADRIEELEKEVEQHEELEALLRSTLVSAENAAQDMKEQARREGDVILADAHAEARSVLRDATEEKERLLSVVPRIQALLRTALGVVSQKPASVQAGDPPASVQAGEPPASETGDPSVRTAAG